MKINLDHCPLVKYLNDNPNDDIDPQMARDMHGLAKDALENGNSEYLYSYALFLFEIVHNHDHYPFAKNFPKELTDAMDSRAFEVFATTAEQGYSEGILMTAFYLAMGYGTPQDTHSARLFCEQARQSIAGDNPRLKALTSLLHAIDGKTPEDFDLPSTKMTSPQIPFGNASHSRGHGGGHGGGAHNVDISREELAEIYAPITATPEKLDNMYLKAATQELIRLVDRGFHKEEEKGALFFALQNALDDLSAEIDKTHENKDVIAVNAHTANALKTGLVQIREAAMLLGGVPKERQNIWLPDFGKGHGEDHEKPYGDRLREVAARMDKLFDQKGVVGLTDQQLDRFEHRKFSPKFL